MAATELRSAEPAPAATDIYVAPMNAMSWRDRWQLNFADVKPREILA